MRLDEEIGEIIEKNENMRSRRKEFFSDNLILVLIYSAVGLVTHGLSLFNHYQYHDDMFGRYDSAGGLVLGRWSANVLQGLKRILFGGSVVSLHLVNGVLALIFLSITSILICEILEVHKLLFRVLLGTLLIVFPVVVADFGFMNSASSYAMGYCLIAGSVFIIVNFSVCHRWIYVIASMMIAFSIGIYQAMIPFLLTLICMYLWLYSIKNDLTMKAWFMEIIKWMAVASGSFLLYVAITYAGLKFFGLTLLEYQGISASGKTSVLTYFIRISDAFLFFVCPAKNGYSDVYPQSVRIWYYVVLVLSVIGVLIMAVALFHKQKIKNSVQMIVMSLVIPLMTNFIYVMCDYRVSTLHTLVKYAHVFHFVFFVAIISVIDEMIEIRKHYKWYMAISMICCIWVCLLYIRFANLCYLKANYLQERAISYMTVLQARIQSIPGYDEAYPVVFINELGKSTSSVECSEQLEDVDITPYHFSTIINDYAWKEFMRMWTGYAPRVETVEDGAYDMYQMPHYPQDGSIQIINNRIVVNF